MGLSRLFTIVFISSLVLTSCQSTAMPTVLPSETNAPPQPTETSQPTANPTETPAVITLAPGQCMELIQNSDFESGTIEPWTFISHPGNPGVVTYRPKSGKYSVGLGGLNADDVLQLDVTIPASAASVTFKFSLSGATQETDNQPHDVLNVSLATPDGNILTPIQKFDNTTMPAGMAFTTVTHDLTKYAGQRVRIVFGARTDGQNPSDFSIDDVSLEACGPIVVATLPSSPTPAPSATPVALATGQCMELIQNGDFETGSAAPWIETSNLNKPLIIQFPGRGNGKFSAFMGSASNADESISQLVAIPTIAASATLTYSWNHASHETDGYAHDLLYVLLRDVAGKDLVTLEKISNATNKNFEFYQSTQDLSKYIGKVIYIVFHAATNPQNDTDFSVDDVSLKACGPK